MHMYMCVLNNFLIFFVSVTLNSSTGSPGLSSLIAPTIVVPPQDRIVDQNRDSVEFECVVNAR